MSVAYGSIGLAYFCQKDYAKALEYSNRVDLAAGQQEMQ